jgi:hypothetical protein
MIRIDDSLLQELGLISLPKPERDQMLRQIYETLEMRVGMKLAERMSDQQLDEFERFIDTNDEAGALKWLETNFPDYKQVVADELDKLKVEIKRDAPQIISAMQQQSAMPQQPAAAPQPVAPPQYQQVAPVPQGGFNLVDPSPQYPPQPAPQQFQAPQPVSQPVAPSPQPIATQPPITPFDPSSQQQAPVMQQPTPLQQDVPSFQPQQMATTDQPVQGDGVVPPPPTF